eukprot:UN27489
MAAEEVTISSHIQHHLTNAKMCMTDSGLAFNKACADSGFWTWNIDTLAWSIGLGLLFYGPSEAPQRKLTPEYRVNFNVLLK